jgi:peptide/nickel transport system permease protein
MTRYLAGRLASGVGLFFAITLCVFIAFFALPTTNRERETTDAYRIHGSMSGAYTHYVWRMVRHGDLGYSYVTRQAVTTQLFKAAPVTLSLVAGGLVVWLLLAIPLGIIAALRPRSLLDRGATLFVLIGVCAHPVWLGLTLSYLFGHYLHVLPAAGYCSIASPTAACSGLGRWAYHLLLPWFTFGMLNAALFTTMTRGLILEELNAEYVRTARAKGVGELRIMRAHLLRNVTLPLMTMLGITVGTALAGVIFVESAFDLPGLGGILRRATMQRDLPLTAGSVLFLALAIMLLNLLVDVLYMALDPRIQRADHGVRS